MPGMPHFLDKPIQTGIHTRFLMPIINLQMNSPAGYWPNSMNLLTLGRPFWHYQACSCPRPSYFLWRKVRESRFQKRFILFTTKQHIAVQIFYLYDEPFNLLVSLRCTGNWFKLKCFWTGSASKRSFFSPPSQILLAFQDLVFPCLIEQSMLLFIGPKKEQTQSDSSHCMSLHVIPPSGFSIPSGYLT